MSQPANREPDDLSVGPQAMGDLLASIPHRLGYRLENSDQLAIQISGPGARALLAVDWRTHRSNMDAADHAVQIIDAVAAPTTNAVLILGYDPQAAQRVYSLRASLKALRPGSTIAAVQVDHDRWRAFGSSVTGDWNRLPQPPIDLLMEGYPAPAPSLQDYRRGFDPLPAPSFGALPNTSRELIDNAPPGIRAELATRTLNRLTDRNPHPLDQAALAHTLADPAVNHRS